MSILLCFYVVTKSRADSNHFRVLLGRAPIAHPTNNILCGIYEWNMSSFTSEVTERLRLECHFDLIPLYFILIFSHLAVVGSSGIICLFVFRKKPIFKGNVWE